VKNRETVEHGGAAAGLKSPFLQKTRVQAFSGDWDSGFRRFVRFRGGSSALGRDREAAG
jgi:hypothetical protein